MCAHQRLLYTWWLVTVLGLSCALAFVRDISQAQPRYTHKMVRCRTWSCGLFGTACITAGGLAITYQQPNTSAGERPNCVPLNDPNLPECGALFVCIFRIPFPTGQYCGGPTANPDCR